MKVHNFNNQEYPVNNKPQKSPAFRAGMTDMLNMSGNLMQGIENSGFLGSFLIQDFWYDNTANSSWFLTG